MHFVVPIPIQLSFSKGGFTLGPELIFLYGSGTLVLPTWVPHEHFLVINILRQRDILSSLVHIQSNIGYKNYKIVKDVSFFITLYVTFASLQNQLNLKMEKMIKSDNTVKN